MLPYQEVTTLRKAGRLDEAYSRGYELHKEAPEDQFLASSIGWVLYEKVKKLVEEAHKGFGFVKDAFVPPDLAGQLKDGQEVNLVVVKKLDKKKNQLGWTAIAIL